MPVPNVVVVETTACQWDVVMVATMETSLACHHRITTAPPFKLMIYVAFKDQTATVKALVQESSAHPPCSPIEAAVAVEWAVDP